TRRGHLDQTAVVHSRIGVCGGDRAVGAVAVLVALLGVDVAGVDDARRATLARRRRRDAGGAEIAAGIDETVVGDGNRRAFAAARRVDRGRQRAVGGDRAGLDAIGHRHVAGTLRLDAGRVIAQRDRATVVDHGDVAAGRVD